MPLDLLVNGLSEHPGGILAWRAIGVPMRVAGLGSHHATPVAVGMFAMGTMVVTFWFTFAVILMARLAKNPRRTYLRTALPLLALASRAGHRSGHGGLDQAHPRRRAPDRRRDHHSGGREAAIATAVSRPAHLASPARQQLPNSTERVASWPSAGGMS
jgi:hypothetical protein